MGTQILGGKDLDEGSLFGKFKQLLGEVSVEEILKLVKRR